MVTVLATGDVVTNLPIDLRYDALNNTYTMWWTRSGKCETEVTPGEIFALAAQMMQTVFMHDRQQYYELRLDSGIRRWQQSTEVVDEPQREA